jgi:hypothetical protein
MSCDEILLFGIKGRDSNAASALGLGGVANTLGRTKELWEGKLGLGNSGRSKASNFTLGSSCSGFNNDEIELRLEIPLKDAVDAKEGRETAGKRGNARRVLFTELFS